MTGWSNFAYFCSWLEMYVFVRFSAYSSGKTFWGLHYSMDIEAPYWFRQEYWIFTKCWNKIIPKCIAWLKKKWQSLYLFRDYIAWYNTHRCTKIGAPMWRWKPWTWLLKKQWAWFSLNICEEGRRNSSFSLWASNSIPYSPKLYFWPEDTLHENRTFRKLGNSTSGALVSSSNYTVLEVGGGPGVWIDTVVHTTTVLTLGRRARGMSTGCSKYVYISLCSLNTGRAHGLNKKDAFQRTTWWGSSINYFLLE